MGLLGEMEKLKKKKKKISSVTYHKIKWNFFNFTFDTEIRKNLREISVAEKGFDVRSKFRYLITRGCLGPRKNLEKDFQN